MEIKEIISKNICGLRKKAMLTQAELADKLNYSDKAISKWERGESLPDAEMLYKIAELFEVDISYLFEEHNFEELSLEDKKKLRTKATIIKTLIAFTFTFIPLIIVVLIISALKVPLRNQKSFFFLAQGIFPIVGFLPCFPLNYSAPAARQTLFRKE